MTTKIDKLTKEEIIILSAICSAQGLLRYIIENGAGIFSDILDSYDRFEDEDERNAFLDTEETYLINLFKHCFTTIIQNDSIEHIRDAILTYEHNDEVLNQISIKTIS